jgi:hypothetical protein
MFHHQPLGVPRRTIDQLVEAAALVALAAMLLIGIPLMARVPMASDVEPRPQPAPRPVAVLDFPEHAHVDGACVAILSKSSAVDNGRARRAAEITSVLLEDACFDG